MNTEMIRHLALERQARFRRDARESALARIARRRHDQPVASEPQRRNSVAL